MTAALQRGEWSAARPGRTLPPGKTRYPFYRRLSGPQCRSGRAENLVPTGTWSPDRPASSQSLYRLSYPVHELSYMPSEFHYSSQHRLITNYWWSAALCRSNQSFISRVRQRRRLRPLSHDFPHSTAIISSSANNLFAHPAPQSAVLFPILKTSLQAL